MLFIRERFKYASIEKLRYTSKITLENFFNDRFWICTLCAIVIKSVLFLSLISNSNASRFEFFKAFYSVPPIAVYICFISLIMSFSFILKGKKRIWFPLFLNILITILIVGDLWHYRGFGTFLSPHLLKETSNLENLTDSILSMSNIVDVIFVSDIIVFVIIAVRFGKRYKRYERSKPTFLVIFIISAVYIFFTYLRVDVFKTGYDSQILFRVCWTPNQTMSNLSPVGYHIYDTFVYLKESRPYKLTEKDSEDIKQWFKEKTENIPDNKYKGIFKEKNLIFIQVESLENFVMKQKINNQEITPNINRLLDNSLYFSNFYEQVYNGTSSDADLLANTSVYPVRRGSTFFRYPDNKYNSMPVLLNKLGYSTVAIHPDKGSYWNWMPALTAMGFDRCIDFSYFKPDEFIGLGLSDGTFLRQVEPILASQKQPFYSFMVTLTSHGPFDLPNEYRELKLEDALDKNYLGGYFQSLHYTDKQLGSFMKKLEEDKLLENSVVVIYGDHTGVHKYYDEDVKKIQPSEEWWHGNNFRIPFIIYSKGLKGEEFKVSGGQIDILPTVAYLMGVNEGDYINTAMGRNLLKTNKDFAVLSSGEVVSGSTLSEKEKNHAIESLRISDMIIRSNYFKDR